ncbi:MAG: hypothetical protein U0518_02755 [Candidatus Gracilibacteria bacterium]
MSITSANLPDDISPQGALFMEVPPERIPCIDSHLELLVVRIQEVAHHLCLVHIIPDDMLSDFRHACCKHPESPTLFGEIWDQGNQRHISALSLDHITHKLAKNIH